MDMAERKIAIVTDSTCDLPDDAMRENNIRFVPLRIVYEAAEYRDRIDITAEQVIQGFSREVPGTTLPLAEDVNRVFNELAAEGYTDAVYLSISSGLSGSYNSVRLMAQQFQPMRITVVDTSTVSMALGFLAMEAAKEAKRNPDPASIVEKVRRIRSRIDALFAVRDLGYLVRGGRLGRVEGAMGSLLDIKPVITFATDGICHTVAKARGFRNAVRKILAIVKEKYEGRHINLAVLHVEALEEAHALLEEIKRFATVCESYIGHLCPVLSVYSGPGLVGIVAYEV
jgi:DegV family protein with EDD domain